MPEIMVVVEPVYEMGHVLPVGYEITSRSFRCFVPAIHEPSRPIEPDDALLCGSVNPGTNNPGGPSGPGSGDKGGPTGPGPGSGGPTGE